MVLFLVLQRYFVRALTEGAVKHEEQLMAQVVLKDVIKNYGSTFAVNNVSFTVQHGVFVALVGPSGCGKTTTLNLVVRLIPIMLGDIIIGDQVVNYLDPRDRNIRNVF